MDASLGKWQEVFNTDFPDGLIMRWDDGTPTRYPIPHVQVIGLAKDQPIVHLDVYEVHKDFVATIEGYTVVRRNPTLARVVAEGYDRLMIWDGNITTYLETTTS